MLQARHSEGLKQKGREEIKARRTKKCPCEEQRGLGEAFGTPAEIRLYVRQCFCTIPPPRKSSITPEPTFPCHFPKNP